MRTPKIQRKLEYMSIIGGEMKATNDAQYIIEGYLNYIGNIDFGDDETCKGAFTQTLKDSYARKSAQSLDFLWPYLWNHDYNLLPPGGIFDADEDRKGLYIKVQFNPDIQMGRELYSNFKMGISKKQSMGYRAIKVDWKTVDGRRIRLLQEVAVMEGSAVVFPMNDLAAVEVVKTNNHGKRSFYMPNRMPGGKAPANRKDFNDAYRPRQIADWKGKLWSIWCALAEAIDDAWESGDSPAEDIQAALNGNDNSPGFIQQLDNWTQEGIALDYSNYMEMQDQQNDSSGSMPAVYGYMSREQNEALWQSKAGRAISSSNMALLKKATDGITEHVKSIKSVMTNAQQQGYPNAGASRDAASALPESKEDDAVSTHLDNLLAELTIKNALRK